MAKDRVEIGEMENGNKLVLAVETPIGVNTSELSRAAEGLKMLYDSLINAGFDEENAMKFLIAVTLK